MAFHPHRGGGRGGRGNVQGGRGGGARQLYFIGGDPPAAARQCYRLIRQNRGPLVENESPTLPNPSDSSEPDEPVPANANDPDPWHWNIAPPGQVDHSRILIEDEDDVMMDAPAPGPDRDNYYYGGNQRENTPSPPENRETGEETSMWTDIKNWIQHVAGTPAAYHERPAPYAVCGACQITEIDIKGIPRSGNPSYGLGLGTVLICGHILCARCYNQWCRDKYNSRHGFNCPLCRAKQQCDSRSCKDIFYPYIIPPARHEKPPGIGWKEFLDYVPLTLGEGGVRPAQCHICRATRLVVLGRTAKRLFQEKCFNALNDPRAQYMGVPYSNWEMAWLKDTTYEPTEHMLQELKKELIMEHPSWGGPVHSTLHIVWNMNTMRPGYFAHKRKVRVAYRAMALDDSGDIDGRVEDLGEAEGTGEKLELNDTPPQVKRVPMAVTSSDLANL